LFSNAQDLVRFSQALFGGEFLSADSLKQMLTFVDEGEQSFNGQQSGLGVQGYQTEYGRQWGHIGGIPGYSSDMRYFPDRNGATGVVLVNGKSSSEETATDVDILDDAIDTLLNKER
jgi:D-alanyl-D-alanine carboxypeptidase